MQGRGGCRGGPPGRSRRLRHRAPRLSVGGAQRATSLRNLHFSPPSCNYRAWPSHMLSMNGLQPAYSASSELFVPACSLPQTLEVPEQKRKVRLLQHAKKPTCATLSILELVKRDGNRACLQRPRPREGLSLFSASILTAAPLFEASPDAVRARFAPSSVAPCHRTGSWASSRFRRRLTSSRKWKRWWCATPPPSPPCVSPRCTPFRCRVFGAFPLGPIATVLVGRS